MRQAALPPCYIVPFSRVKCLLLSLVSMSGILGGLFPTKPPLNQQHDGPFQRRAVSASQPAEAPFASTSRTKIEDFDDPTAAVASASRQDAGVAVLNDAAAAAEPQSGLRGIVSGLLKDKCA